jgi:hypothetical protein
MAGQRSRLKRTSNDAAPHPLLARLPIALSQHINNDVATRKKQRIFLYVDFHSPFPCAVQATAVFISAIRATRFNCVQAPESIGCIQSGVFRGARQDKLCEENLKLEEGGSARAPGLVMVLWRRGCDL